jgi:hypothetical protein
MAWDATFHDWRQGCNWDGRAWRDKDWAREARQDEDYNEQAEDEK